MDDEVGLLRRHRGVRRDVGHPQQHELTAEDLLVAGECVTAIATEEQVGTEVHLDPPRRTGVAKFLVVRPRARRNFIASTVVPSHAVATPTASDTPEDPWI